MWINDCEVILCYVTFTTYMNTNNINLYQARKCRLGGGGCHHPTNQNLVVYSFYYAKYQKIIKVLKYNIIIRRYYVWTVFGRKMKTIFRIFFFWYDPKFNPNPIKVLPKPQLMLRLNMRINTMEQPIYSMHQVFTMKRGEIVNRSAVQHRRKSQRNKGAQPPIQISNSFVVWDRSPPLKL